MKNSKTRNAYILAAGLLLLLMGGCGGNSNGGYTTVRPEMGTVENILTDTGAVAYGDSHAIVPKVSGKVISCAFEEGAAVTEGQTLYIIDSVELEDRISQAELALKSAEEAYAQSVSAQADLTVRSHASGAVTAVYCHVGDYVSVGTRIADVVDSANLVLTVPFSKADAAGITAGSPAIVSFQMYAETLTGTVKRVHDAPSVLPGGSEGVYVEIGFQNPGALSSGAAAMAEVGGAACMDFGVVGYATEQSVYATQSGQVLTLPIEAGTAVSKGQTVMTIRNSALTNAAANAGLARDASALSLKQLREKLPDYTILAPADGIMVSRTLKEGDFASAAVSMASLALVDSLCVKVDIDELYIGLIRPGQTAAVSFTAKSSDENTYEAVVRRIDETGLSAGGVTKYTVELTLGKTDGLKEGMNVSVAIVTERKEGCLRLPSRAVSGNTVLVLKNGKPVETAVKTGVSGGGYTEITDGLSGNDEVVLP